MLCDAGHRAHGVGTLAEPEPYIITAGCSHDVAEYEIEYVYLDNDCAPTLCSKCMEEKFEKWAENLTTDDKAYLLRYGGVPVRDYS